MVEFCRATGDLPRMGFPAPVFFVGWGPGSPLFFMFPQMNNKLFGWTSGASKFLAGPLPGKTKALRFEAFIKCTMKNAVSVKLSTIKTKDTMFWGFG